MHGASRRLAYATGASAIAAGGFAVYYKREVCRPPEVYYHQDSVHAKLAAKCTSLTRPFEPTFWMYGTHAQTILGALFRTRRRVITRRDLVRTVDGGHVALDWDLAALDDPDVPILVIFPGLTGGIHAKYIRELMQDATRAGMRPVVMGYRGYHLKLQTPMVTTSVDIRDLDDAVRAVHAKFPDAPLYTIGFSMGANMLVKYLGTLATKNDCPAIKGAIAVSNPFDFVECSRKLKEIVNEVLYSRPLCYLVKTHMSSIEDLVQWWINRNCHLLNARLSTSPFKARTIHELDDSLCRRLYNFDSIEDYYYESSSVRYLSQVDCPLLLLNARDDPFLGIDIPVTKCVENPNIVFAITNKGGHIGWVTGVWPTSWMNRTCLEYLQLLQRDQLVKIEPISNKS